MELGLDVLRVNFLKYVKKINCLVCGEVVKNCNNILFFKSILVIFDVVGSFGLMFTQWICCTLLCTLCALNAFICYKYYTQSTTMELQCVKVQHNVQESAYQYFALISFLVKAYNTYFSVGNYNAMYYSCLLLLCVYFIKSHNTL